MNLILVLLMLLSSPIPLEDIGEVPTSPVSSFDTLSQFFGYREHVGIDFKLPAGSPIYAILDGVIIEEVNDSRCYGRYLMLEHNDGNVSLYAHLSEFKVKIGDKVTAGRLIALSGGDLNDNIDGDGWTSAPHLHWEIRTKNHIDNNNYNINPIEYLLSFNGIEYEFRQTLLKWLNIGNDMIKQEEEI